MLSIQFHDVLMASADVCGVMQDRHEHTTIVVVKHPQFTLNKHVYITKSFHIQVKVMLSSCIVMLFISPITHVQVNIIMHACHFTAMHAYVYC